MRQWSKLFSALLLVLILWTGTVANADGYLPVAVAGEGAAHFDGDKDQVPADDHTSTPHHHATGGEQFAVASNDLSAVGLATNVSELRVRASESFERLRQPDSELRPPIA